MVLADQRYQGWLETNKTSYSRDPECTHYRRREVVSGQYGLAFLSLPVSVLSDTLDIRYRAAWSLYTFTYMYSNIYNYTLVGVLFIRVITLNK